MYRLRMTFRKDSAARFLSHLDLMATLEYALRRARLPLALSEGFNPRPRLSLAAPLALGHIGEAEILEIVLSEPVPPGDVMQRLQAVLPPGITILSAAEIPGGEKTAAARLRGAHYRIELPSPVPGLGERVDGLMRRTVVEVEEQRDGRARVRDVRPLIAELEAARSDLLRLHVQMQAEGAVRPEQVLDLLNVSRDGARITRERIDLTG